MFVYCAVRWGGTLLPKAIGRAMEWPLRHGCTVRAGLPSYNLSVCFADSSPSRGNGDDRRQRRKQGGAVGAAASRMRATAKQTLGAATRVRSTSGETVHFAGTAKASPTRGGGSASALTERLSPAAAHGQASISPFPLQPPTKRAAAPCYRHCGSRML